MEQQKHGEEQRQYVESMTSTMTATGWNEPRKRLQQAFAADEFMLYGQAILPLDRARKLPVGMEILVRLREEEQTLTPPGAFLPVLEYFDLMPTLDRWVTRHAVRWWRDRKSNSPMVLHVNLAPDTLENDEFPGYVAAQLREGGMPAAHVCFEMTAPEMAAGSDQARKTAAALKELGCQIAVSAFGRDAISFDALRTVSGNVVKIDGALVRTVHSDEVSMTKVRSIQRVCATAGVRTIAEFVEQQETLAKLRELGVDYVQGYGVAKPEPLTA